MISARSMLCSSLWLVLAGCSAEPRANGDKAPEAGPSLHDELDAGAGSAIGEEAADSASAQPEEADADDEVDAGEEPPLDAAQGAAEVGDSPDAADRMDGAAESDAAQVDARAATDGAHQAEPLDALADAADAPACVNSLPAWSEPPARLSQTGLYADIAVKQVAPSMRLFEPQFALWSDGAVKSRFMYLPECDGVIDTRDMDSWSFPVGARAFKEFALGGRRIETRFVYRYGPGSDDFMFAHYLWNEDESDALLITDTTPVSALVHPKGLEYTVPSREVCTSCHGARGGPSGGTSARFLGFSAIQLSHQNQGATLRSLSEERKLSHGRLDGVRIPGEGSVRAALGYLHANCSHCHNEGPDGVAFPAEPLSFMLKTSDQQVERTATYLTAVGVPPAGYVSTCSHRVLPGDVGLREPAQAPVQSCVVERMASRTESVQMPPLATHKVHPEGVALIRAWIQGLAVGN
ncbi:MAG TPA: hypothetical protein VFZ61_26120 [Polyangiales bacterium]